MLPFFLRVQGKFRGPLELAADSGKNTNLIKIVKRMIDQPQLPT